MSRFKHRMVALTAVAIGLLLAACSGTSTAGSATPAASATVSTTGGCASVPGFEHASTSSLGTHFTDVGFPSGAVAYLTTPPETNGFQYRLVHVCVTGSGADAVRSFYGTGVVTQGWSTTATLPSTGDLSTACTNPPYCWIKNDGVIRFLGLEDVATAGPLTTFALRLVIEPLSSGGGLLNPGDAFDFDPTGLGSGTNDVTWTGSQMTPSSGAGMHNVGLGVLGTLTYADVAGYPYAAVPLSAGTLAVSDLFAVQTSDHHVVKVRVENHLGTQLTLQWVTYPYTF
jgi:hypothetical protein